MFVLELYLVIFMMIRCIKKNTPGDQHGIYADKSIQKFIKKKNFIKIEDGLKNFYTWATKIKLNKFG